jgi:hypothetical protein
METTEKAPRRKASSMPFIMPDGRPLGVFLTETNHMTTSGRSGRKGRGRTKEPATGWSSRISNARSSTNTTQSTPLPRPPRVMTEAETAEMAALEKVGQRRQRRWLNEKLLRDMAPPLTAKDMESLFKPAPFGDTGYVSAFTLAAAPEHAPLWDLFRSVDSDKQNRVLLKWEEHVKELRAEVNNNKEGGLKQADSAVVAATVALQGWAAVGPRGRKALRRAPRGCIEEIEAPILRLVENPVETEISLELEGGFQRLLAHSVAKFHFLFAQSRDSLDNGNGGKVVVVRKRRTIGEESTSNKNASMARNKSKSPQRETTTSSPAHDSASHAATGASPSSSSQQATPPPPSHVADIVGASTPFDASVPRFTCVDILWLLDDGTDELNAKTLRESLVGHDQVDHASMMEVASRVHVVSPVVAH